jgi:hypothetical protein
VDLKVDIVYIPSDHDCQEQFPFNWQSARGFRLSGTRLMLCTEADQQFPKTYTSLLEMRLDNSQEPNYKRIQFSNPFTPTPLH